MTRIDFRPWASVLVLAAVVGYIGCSTTTMPPAVTSTGAPKPAHAGGETVAKTGPSEGDAVSGPQKLFATLGNPAAVLVVSGEQGNYMEPCGCSAEQLGGLIRRYDLVERLRSRNWPTALIELGTLIKNPATGLGGFEQAKIKFDFALKALALLKYDAVALSAEDLKLGVFEALGYFLNSLGETTKIVVANVEPDATFKKMFRTKVVASAGPVTLGITAVIDPETLQKLVDQDKDRDLPVVKRPEDVLPSVLAELDAKTTYQILMVQGPPELARRLAETNPGFDIVVSTSESDEPLSREAEVLNGGKTMLVSVGKKGKYVGVFGFYPQEKERLRYQLETLDKSYDAAAAPMRKLIRDDYRDGLKSAGVVENFVRRDYVGGAPGATFVGAETCKECHPKTFAFWSHTDHAHAFASLLSDPKPNTAFDAECVSCHTTGFEYNSGWISPAATPHLAGNQCENCHGPGSKHCAAPTDPQFLDAISVTIEQAEKNRLCYRCHDEDNSRDFKLDEYWPRIKHNALDDYTDPKVKRPIIPKIPRPAAAAGAK
jgi:hypothetical protein